MISVRRAGLEDLETYLSLYYEFFSELRSRQGWRPHSIEEYREEALTHLKRDTVFLAIDDGEAVGFARVSERDGSYWIEELYVKPEHRGKGIGRALIEAVENHVARRDDAVYIMVLPQDLRALEFWLHMGYDTLNTIELVKELSQTPRSQTGRRTTMLHGYKIHMWRWRREEYDQELKEFLNALEEYARKGWNRKTLLRALTRAVQDLLGGQEEH